MNGMRRLMHTCCRHLYIRPKQNVVHPLQDSARNLGVLLDKAHNVDKAIAKRFCRFALLEKMENGILPFADFCQN